MIIRKLGEGTDLGGNMNSISVLFQLAGPSCGLRDTDLGVTPIEIVHEVMGMNSSLAKKRE